MAVLSRFARLVSADLHAVIDHLETPEALLRQALREMREQIDSTESACARGAKERQRLRDRQERIDARLGQLSPDIDSALQADRDELARHLLRERIALEREQEDGAARLSALERELAEHRQRLAEQRECLRQLDAEADRALAETAPTRRTPDGIGPIGVVSDADVEIALIRAKQAGRPS
jgi:phage shock protein A